MGDSHRTVGDGTSSEGKKIVLKVERNEDLVMALRVSKCSKYSIFTLSYVFLLLSIGLFALGIWAQSAKSGVLFNLSNFDPNKIALIFDPTIIVLIIGAIVIIISFFGTIGSLRDNCFYLMLYACLLGLMVITYIVLIVTGVFISRVLLKVVGLTIHDTILLYRDEPDLQLLVDWIQINAKCCGASSPHDWNENIYFSDTGALQTYKSPEGGGVPFSCCKETKSTVASLSNRYCGMNARKAPPDVVLGSNQKFLRKDIHDQGCIETVKSFLLKNLFYVIPAVILFFSLHFYCISAARSLQNQIFDQREEWYNTDVLKVSVHQS